MKKLTQELQKSRFDVNKMFTKEMKWGIGILSFYFVWALGWVIYKFFVKGSIDLPYTPQIHLETELARPFANGFSLGSDYLGRSLIEVLSAGLSYSLTLSLVVTIITTSIGIIFGYLAIKAPSFVNWLFDLLINLVFIFPSILIAIMIMSMTGQSIKGLIFAMAVTGWPSYAKIVRGESKRILAMDYVEGARAIGIGEFRLFFRIVLPGIFPVLVVNMVLGLSGVIISEAALGFLGLGGSPYSWGGLLSSAKTVLLEAPHVTIILSVTMSGLIIGLNLLGDGIRDYLDPVKG